MDRKASGPASDWRFRQGLEPKKYEWTQDQKDRIREILMAIDKKSGREAAMAARLEIQEIPYREGGILGTGEVDRLIEEFSK